MAAKYDKVVKVDEETHALLKRVARAEGIFLGALVAQLARAYDRQDGVRVVSGDALGGALARERFEGVRFDGEAYNQARATSYERRLRRLRRRDG